MVPFRHGREGDEFGEAGWPGRQVCGQPSEVIQGLVNALAQINSGFASLGEGVLEAPKHVPRTRQGDRH